MSLKQRIYEKSTKAFRQNQNIRKGLLYAGILIIAFLLGFIPMWFTAQNRANRLAQMQRELNLAYIQNKLAAAVIDARRGKYEVARQSVSDFFTDLRVELERGNNSSLSEVQREQIRPLFAQRDEIITLLARNDPAAVERLSTFYITYVKVIEADKINK